MSADNGIYIATFADQARVIETQAIDNLNWHFEEPSGTRSNGSIDENVNLAELAIYYWNAKIFPSDGEATHEAINMYRESMNNGFVEYGICHVFRTADTWEEFVIKAKEKAKIELAALKDTEKWDSRWNYEREDLKNLANGEFTKQA